MTGPNHQVPARSLANATHPSVTFEGGTEQPSLQTQQLSSASSYADLNFLFGVQDPAMLVPKTNRNRRKSNQGPDHTKHRRTRSGCYTCRSRRVKVGYHHPHQQPFYLSIKSSAMKPTQFANVRERYFMPLISD